MAATDRFPERHRPVLARAQPGPARHPRLGARLRRGRRAPGRGRVGRARGDALADHPGGREDRPLRLRGARAVLRRRDRPDAADRQRGAVLGRRRDRHGDHGHVARRSPRSSARAPASRSASGSRAASARPTSRRSRPFCVVRARRRLRRLGAAHDARASTRRTDEWVLNGQKAWATNGGIADVHVVVASVDRELGARGHAAFVVPPRTRRASSRARRSASTACAPRTPPTCFLDDCRIPAGNVLGGKEKLDERLARAREGTRAKPPGRDGDLRGDAARRSAPRRSASRARPTSTRSSTPSEREQFGRPIVDNQAIAFTLADMKLEIDAARLLVWRASWMGAPRARRSRTPRAR